MEKVSRDVCNLLQSRRWCDLIYSASQNESFLLNFFMFLKLYTVMCFSGVIRPGWYIPVNTKVQFFF